MPRCLGGTWKWVFLLISVSAACVWPSPERQLLLDFFQACQIYDTTVLARLATVSCNPRLDGVVQRFEIERIDGTDATRDVTIRAQVRRLERGVTSDRTMTARIERRDGRWMVTSLTPPPASQTSPAASSAPPR